MQPTDCMAWLPAGMPDEEKLAYIDGNPGDCHGAAAEAWESWGASLQPAPGSESSGMGVQSVSTGAQSVTYADGLGGGAAAEAFRRSAWHRARSRVKAMDVGGEYDTGMTLRPGIRMAVLDGRDAEDRGTIPTYDIDAEGRR